MSDLLVEHSLQLFDKYFQKHLRKYDRECVKKVFFWKADCNIEFFYNFIDCTFEKTEIIQILVCSTDTLFQNFAFDVDKLVQIFICTAFLALPFCFT